MYICAEWIIEKYYIPNKNTFKIKLKRPCKLLKVYSKLKISILI